MSDRVVLVYDVGTQSSRALLINQRGEILAKSQVKHLIPYESPYPGWAEKDADFYYENICQASRELKTRYPELFAKTEAVSVTTIRDTVVCVDREGKPLRPAILWLDKRKAVGKPVFSQVTRMLLKTVGMEETANLQYQKSHCNWIRQREPEIWEKTYKYLLLSGYLVYRLTGIMADAAAEAMVHKRDVFEPDMEQNRIYRRLYEEVFKNIYGRLSGLYERLQEIYQEEEDKIMI